MVWFNDTRAELFSHFQPLETAWDAAMSVLRTVFGGATIPLLWLAVAGIIYGVTMPDWRGAARRFAGDRADRVFDRAAETEKRVSGPMVGDFRVASRGHPRMGASQDGQFQHDRRFGATHPARRRAGVVTVRASAIWGWPGWTWPVLSTDPRSASRVSVPRCRMASRSAPVGVLERCAANHHLDLAPDHRTSSGVPDRVDRRLLPRTRARTRNCGNYNSIRTVISPSNLVTSIAVGTTSCGSKNVN